MLWQLVQRRCVDPLCADRQYRTVDRGHEPDRRLSLSLHRPRGEPQLREQPLWPHLPVRGAVQNLRSEEPTSELQSLMRISYAVFCLKKKNNISEITCTRKKRY